MESTDMQDVLYHAQEAANAESPEDQPHASAYKAIEILRKALESKPSQADEAAMKGRLGALYIQVEEPHNAQPELEAAASFFFPSLMTFVKNLPDTDATSVSLEQISKLIQDLNQIEYQTTNSHIVYAMEVLNQLGFLWSNRSQPMKALCYLHAGEQVLETSQVDSLKCLEVTIQTHFFLAQLYGILDLPDESAKYCLATLEYQLDQMESRSDVDQSHDAIEWARNALRIVEFFQEADELQDAMTCLKACDYVLTKYNQSEDVKQVNADKDIAYATVYHRLLQLSELEDKQTSRASQTKFLTLRSLDKLSLEADSVDLSKIQSFDQAREVFRKAFAYTEKALEYYVLDGHVSSHVNIIQLESRLYKRLLGWEESLKRKIGMQRRRLNLLTPLTQELNPTAFISLVQELFYECGEICANLFDLKMEQEGGREKANGYAIQAVSSYQQYLHLFYPSNKEVPMGRNVELPSSDSDASDVRSLLVGYFALARVSGNVMFPGEVQKTVGFWKTSLQCHEAVVELVKQFQKKDGQKAGPGATESIEQQFEAELMICEEMKELLPEKINQLVYNGKVL